MVSLLHYLHSLQSLTQLLRQSSEGAASSASRSSFYLLKASEDTSNITLVAVKATSDSITTKSSTVFDEKSMNTVRLRVLTEWLSVLNLGADPLELQELVASIEEIV